MNFADFKLETASCLNILMLYWIFQNAGKKLHIYLVFQIFKHLIQWNNILNFLFFLHFLHYRLILFFKWSKDRHGKIKNLIGADD